MHRVLLRRPLAYVSCIIFCTIVYRVPGGWGIIYMNSSDLTNYTVSFTDLSRIMKNLRNAFIYTASTQQRNGNFQQWLPYNALCLGKATPSHCILETMRPHAWARSSSHRLPGRSLPAALPLPAVLQPPGRAFRVWTQPRGIHPIPIQPAGRAGPCTGGSRLLRAAGCTGASLQHGAVRDPINPWGLYWVYTSGLWRGAGGAETAWLPSPGTNRKQRFEVPPTKRDPIPGRRQQHQVPLCTLGCRRMQGIRCHLC